LPVASFPIMKIKENAAKRFPMTGTRQILTRHRLISILGSSVEKIIINEAHVWVASGKRLNQRKIQKKKNEEKL